MRADISLWGAILSGLAGCANKEPNPRSDPFEIYDELKAKYPEQCGFSETNTQYGGALNEPKNHQGVFSCKNIDHKVGEGLALTEFILIDERNYRYEHLQGKGTTGSTYFIRAQYQFNDGSVIEQNRSAQAGVGNLQFGRSGREISLATINWDVQAYDHTTNLTLEEGARHLNAVQDELFKNSF